METIQQRDDGMASGDRAAGVMGSVAAEEDKNNEE